MCMYYFPSLLTQYSRKYLHIDNNNNTITNHVKKEACATFSFNFAKL